MRVTRFAVCAFLAAATPSHDIHKDALLQVSPELTKPQEDKKFFKSDYPSDQRPVPSTIYDHPYPDVQSSKRFNKDYVKDENADKGQWAAEMDYAGKQKKLAREKREAEDARRKEEAERAKYEEKAGQEKAADEDARRAEEDEKKAEKEADDAASDLDTVAAEKGSGDASTVAEGTEKVEAAVLHLAGCKERLDNARKRLDELLAENDRQEDKLEQARKDVEAAEAKAKAAKQDADAHQSITDAEAKEHQEAFNKLQAFKENKFKLDTDMSEAGEKLKSKRKEKGSAEKEDGKEEAPVKKDEAGTGANPTSFMHSGGQPMAAAPVLILAVALAAVVS